MGASQDLAEIIEAKRREFEAAGIDFSAWQPWPVPLCDLDDGQRLAPHGDPLSAALRAAGGQ